MSDQAVTDMALGGGDKQPQDEFAGQVDYFGVEEEHIFLFPDGKTYIKFKKLMEGERKQYLDATNKDVALNRQTGDMKIKMTAGSDKWALLELAVVDWNLVRKQGDRMVPVTFSKGSGGSTFRQWLTVADPNIVDDLERAIRKVNPWLIGEITLEDIEKQRKELDDLERQIREREAGK